MTEKGNLSNTSRTLEFQFPFLFLRLRSFTALLGKIGNMKLIRAFSWFLLASVPILGCFSIYLVFSSLYTMLTESMVREAARDLGPFASILLPGITPYLPAFYGLVGLIIAILVHEGAHGVIAKNSGIEVKSSGVLFFILIPIGAFVDLNEEQMKKIEIKDVLRVLTGGPGSNLFVGLICLSVVLLVVSGLQPVMNGLYIVNIMEGMPSEESGFQTGDVIVRINSETIETIEDLGVMLENKNPGETVMVIVARGEKWETQVSLITELSEYEGRTILGLRLTEILSEQRLNNYLNPSLSTILLYLQPPTLALVPFSDILSPFYTHPIGPYWTLITNFFFWIWFVNINLAAFNTLPIYPLDGGKSFESVLNIIFGKTYETTIRKITRAVTLLFLSILIALIVLPYFL